MDMIGKNRTMRNCDPAHGFLRIRRETHVAPAPFVESFVEFI